ncbi:MAG: hypothetical protein KBF99_16365, partial [Leptospiraceae bacterium]|nr:hypothetical protein [Leptospiraceae bacterium]
MKHANPKPSSKDQVKFFSATAFAAIIITVSYIMGVPHYFLGWMAFSVAAFSVAGNDAIQTVGTFIESKRKTHWVPKVVMLCGLLIVVHAYGWVRDNGEIHFDRLKTFPETPEFNIFQLLAPIVLVIITRLKAPISTTFLILGLFGGSNIEKMLNKSFLGYGIAFLFAMAFWGTHAFFAKKEYMKGFEPKPKKEKKWAKLQWLSTAFLWIAWLLQDTANIAIFLPRKLSIYEFFAAISIIAFAIGMIILSNGGTIQEVVSEKSDIAYSKAATLVDIAYALVLLVFQKLSSIPMSTTWVFLGLLAGREIVLHLITKEDKPYLQTFRQVGKDVLLATMGITISLAIYFASSYIYPNQPSSKGNSIKS